MNNLLLVFTVILILIAIGGIVAIVFGSWLRSLPPTSEESAEPPVQHGARRPH